MDIFRRPCRSVLANLNSGLSEGPHGVSIQAFSRNSRHCTCKQLDLHVLAHCLLCSRLTTVTKLWVRDWNES